MKVSSGTEVLQPAGPIQTMMEKRERYVRTAKNSKRIRNNIVCPGDGLNEKVGEVLQVVLQVLILRSKVPGSTRVEKFHMASNARAVAAKARRVPMILNTELKSKVGSSKFSHNRGV